MPFLEHRTLKSGKTSWRIVFADRPGHRRVLNVGICSKRIAEQRLAEVRTTIALGKDPFESSPRHQAAPATISQLAAVDIEWCTPRMQPRAIEFNTYALRHLIGFSGDIEITKVNSEIVSRLVLKLSESYSPTSVNMILRSLKATFSRAVTEHHLLNEHPFKSLKRLATPSNRRIQFLTTAQVVEFLSAVEKRPNFLRLIQFYLWTGARRREALELTLSDIDFNAGLIYLGDEQSQTKRRRSIPMTERLQKLLEEAIAARPGSERPFSADVETFKRHLATLRKDGKVPTWLTIHTLRHTFASHLAMQGVDLSTIASLLGHTTTQTTELYAHLQPEHRSAALKRLPY